MDSQTTAFIVLTAVVGLFALSRFKPKLVRAKTEQAILRSRSSSGSEPLAVFFDQAYIIPALDTYEFMNLAIKSLGVSLKGLEGVRCRDNIRMDIGATFQLKIPHNADSVLKVAQSVGCDRASDLPTLTGLYSSKFIEAIQIVLKKVDFEQAINEREQIRDAVIETIGIDLNGYQLEDVSIEYLEQTALEYLDPKNILDAEAITKITDRTAAQHAATNKIRRGSE